MSKKWQIPVTWEMCGVVTVEADTLVEAVDRANNDDEIGLPSGQYVDSSFEVSIDDLDCIRTLYNNNQPDGIRNMGYSETVQYAIDNIKKGKDFYIDFTEFERPARIHLYIDDIGGTDWYHATAEVFNGTAYTKVETLSDCNLEAFKHCVGVCWHHLNNLVPSISQEEKLSSNPRLASLRDYSKNEETLRIAAKRQQDEKRASLILKIRALAPRIDELIATGNACLQSKIPMTGQAFGIREGYDTNQFFTNSWSHLVGFVGNPHLQPCHIEFLGINAGGACGVYNFRTNGVDVFSVHEKKPDDTIPPSIGDMERFLNSFEDFESSFYAYVDSVIDKQRKSVDKLISSAQEKSDKQTSSSVNRDAHNPEL